MDLRIGVLTLESRLRGQGLALPPTTGGPTDLKLCCPRLLFKGQLEPGTPIFVVVVQIQCLEPRLQNSSSTNFYISPFASFFQACTAVARGSLNTHHGQAVRDPPIMPSPLTVSEPCEQVAHLATHSEAQLGGEIIFLLSPSFKRRQAMNAGWVERGMGHPTHIYGVCSTITQYAVCSCFLYKALNSLNSLNFLSDENLMLLHHPFWVCRQSILTISIENSAETLWPESFGWRL